MKALVSGGAGFIGSNTVDLLLAEGYDIAVVDNLSAGRRENLHEDVVFHKVDICDRKSLDDVFKKEKPEYIVHLAAQANVRKSIEDPLFDLQVNVGGSINLLECARKYGVQKIVYSSSGGAVYGEPQYLPADEKHPVKPLCPYGASKYAVEKYLDVYGIEHVSLRYANVYGPRQDPLGEAGVVAIFANNFLENKAPHIFGDGLQTRDFVYVKDVAEANLKALEKKTSATALNIGSGVEISVNELTEKLAEITGSNVEPKHVDAVEGEVGNISLDATLAKKELGWSAETSLDAGLKETVEWVKQGN